jgi:hypothetical protein
MIPKTDYLLLLVGRVLLPLKSRLEDPEVSHKTVWFQTLMKYGACRV